MAEKTYGEKMDGKNFLHLMKEVDEKLTKRLSVSATASSPLSHLRPYLKALEISCHGIPWLGGCILALWLSENPQFLAYVFNMLIALLIDIIFVVIAKASVRRRRPKTNNMDMFMTFTVDKLSFPSGHASRAVLLACIFYSTLSLHTVFNVLLVAWSISICSSRVLLGRHYVFDVVFGALLGIFEFKLMVLIWCGSERALYILSWFTSFENFHADYTSEL
ncbi:polyisoprenoid diphosphate/phosphate phosphohydrolase PLPP6-like isoform X2 [Tachypleus tridentatus]